MKKAIFQISKAITFLPIIGFVFILLFSLNACSPAKKLAKAEKKAEAFYNANPDKLRDKSEIMFPDRITAELIGVDKIIGDRVSVDSATTPGVIRETRTIERLRVDTLIKRDGRDASRIADLAAEVDSLQSQLIAEIRGRAAADVSAANMRAIVAACVAGLLLIVCIFIGLRKIRIL